MEEKCGQLQNDNSRLKELAEISQHQVESITMRQQSQEKELISIRKRLNEMQMETDEKTVIGQFDSVFYIAREVLSNTPPIYMNVNRMCRYLLNL